MGVTAELEGGLGGKLLELGQTKSRLFLPAHLEGEADLVALLKALEREPGGGGEGHRHRVHAHHVPLVVAELLDRLVFDHDRALTSFGEITHDSADGVRGRGRAGRFRPGISSGASEDGQGREEEGGKHEDSHGPEAGRKARLRQPGQSPREVRCGDAAGANRCATFDPMHPPIVIVGLGELGGSFGRAFLRAGHPVYPVVRGMSFEALTSVPEPALVLVAVGEAELSSVLSGLPHAVRDRVGLLQNELLPRDWEAPGIERPTVAIVWFEKKPGTVEKVLLPTVVAGPRAALVRTALEGIGIPTRGVGDGAELVDELVLKNLYILTTNFAGLARGGTVGELFERDRGLVEAIASEVLDIQEGLLGRRVDRASSIEGLVKAAAADPAHATRGRSAPLRLARALAHADTLRLEVPRLRALAEDHLRTESC